MREMCIRDRMCIVLRKFSDVNHVFGRDIGDAVMKEIGWQLERNLGVQFYFYRIDGARFLAVSQTVLELSLIHILFWMSDKLVVGIADMKMAQYEGMPVSYTHLDVYKRQPQTDGHRPPKDRCKDIW